MTKDELIALLADERVQIEEVSRADWPGTEDQLTVVLSVPKELQG